MLGKLIVSQKTAGAAWWIFTKAILLAPVVAVRGIDQSSALKLSHLTGLTYATNFLH